MTSESVEPMPLQPGDLATVVPINAGGAGIAEVTSADLLPTVHEGHAATDDSANWAVPYRNWAVLTDAATALLVAVIAIRVAGISPQDNRPVPRVYLGTTILAPLVWPLMVAWCRGYDRRHLATGTGEFRAIVSASVRLLAFTGLLSYATYSGRPLLSRYAVLFFFTALPLASLLLRHRQRLRLYRQRLDGNAVSRTLIVGTQDGIEHLVRELVRDPAHGLQPSASCVLARHQRTDPVRQVMDDIARVRPEVVIVTSPSGMDPSATRRLSWLLEEHPVQLMMSPGLFDVVGPRLSIRPAAGLSLLQVERPGIHGLKARYKAVFDRVAATLLLIVALPLLVVIAIVIRLDSRGPVLFRQERIGVKGDPFEMLKFRSMVPDAENQLATVRTECDDGNGHLFKSHADPRVTRVGRILRKYSLDELPQLINVLRGNMSLVGPRPPLQREVDEYETDTIRRLHVRPGLTGLWQVSGRSNLSWEDSIRLDLTYVDNWSVLLDLQILWRTLRAVVKPEGAY